MYIPKKLFINDTVHKTIFNKKDSGILECGFLHKKDSSSSNIDTVSNIYSALLLLSGRGTYEDENGIKIDLYPGCFVQRLPGVKHSTHIYPDGKWLECFISFGEPTFNALCDLRILDKNTPVLFPGVNLGIIEEFSNFLSTLKTSPDENLPYLLLDAQKIIYTIYRMDSNKHNYKMEQAALLLKQNVTKKIKVQDIASSLGMGYESFRKQFKAYTGISPGDYIINQRIDLAKSLLLSQKHTIEEISSKLGYADQFTFSKQFKQITGLSPSSFKNAK